MIDLHYFPTPNGRKVTILLEEANIPYRIVPCSIIKGDQFSEEFQKICPNNRIPAIVDTEPVDGGEPIGVFESGAIMLYLAEKVGQFYPQDLRKRYAVNQWLMWQMANQGPKTGDCNYFRNAAQIAKTEGDQSYAIRRFTDEVNRLYGVMNNQLWNQRYLIGDEYTIADMICYPWTVSWEGQGQQIAEFPYFKRWFEELAARPALQAGMKAGSDLAAGFDPKSLSPEEITSLRKRLYNQRARPAPTGGLL